MARDAAELKEVLQSVSDMLKPFYAQASCSNASSHQQQTHLSNTYMAHSSLQPLKKCINDCISEPCIRNPEHHYSCCR